MLISIISVLMIFLTASAMTTVVFAEEPYWGTLKAGDEMRWHWATPSPMGTYLYGHYELKILEIRGESLKVYYNDTGFRQALDRMVILKCGIATFTSDDLWPYIYPASLIQEDEDIKTTTYEYEGVRYKAAYLKENSQYGGIDEYWWDYSTGILFQRNVYYDDSGPYTLDRLEYTNADLTERRLIGGLCLGTICIAFVSVATLVTYSLVQYHKKRKP